MNLSDLYAKMENLKRNDDDLCSADMDDIPDFEYNKGVDSCLRLLKEYIELLD